MTMPLSLSLYLTFSFTHTSLIISIVLNFHWNIKTNTKMPGGVRIKHNVGETLLYVIFSEQIRLCGAAS